MEYAIGATVASALALYLYGKKSGADSVKAKELKNGKKSRKKTRVITDRLRRDDSYLKRVRKYFSSK